MNVNIGNREKEIVIKFTGPVTERVGVPPEYFESSSTIDNILTLTTSRRQEILIGNTKGDPAFNNVTVRTQNEFLIFTVNGVEYNAGINKGLTGKICVGCFVTDFGDIYVVLTQDGMNFEETFAGTLNYRCLEVGDTFITIDPLMEQDENYRNLKNGPFIEDKIEYPEAHTLFGDPNSDLFTIEKAEFENKNIYMRIK